MYSRDENSSVPDCRDEYGSVLLALDVLYALHGDVVQPLFPQLRANPHHLLRQVNYFWMVLLLKEISFLKKYSCNFDRFYMNFPRIFCYPDPFSEADPDPPQWNGSRSSRLPKTKQKYSLFLSHERSYRWPRLFFTCPCFVKKLDKSKCKNLILVLHCCSKINRLHGEFPKSDNLGDLLENIA